MYQENLIYTKFFLNGSSLILNTDINPSEWWSEPWREHSWQLLSQSQSGIPGRGRKLNQAILHLLMLVAPLLESLYPQNMFHNEGNHQHERTTHWMGQPVTNATANKGLISWGHHGGEAMCRYPPAEFISPARHGNKSVSHLPDQPIQQLNNTNKESQFWQKKEWKNHPAKPYPNSHKILSECSFCSKPASFELICSAAIHHGNAGQAGWRDSAAIFAIKVKKAVPQGNDFSRVWYYPWGLLGFCIPCLLSCLSD